MIINLPEKEFFDFFERNKRETGVAMPNAHFHDHHELYYLVSGKTKYFIGSELYLLQPGDIIFVPKGEYHRTDNFDTPGIERILLIFDDDFVGSDLKPYVALLAEKRHLRLPQEKLHLLANLFKKIEEEETQKPDGYQKMQQLYLKQMLITVARHHQDISSQNLSDTYQRIQDAARYIRTNYSQDLHLDALARKYAISPGHFSKLFQKITGVKVSEYITVSRICAAQELLCAGNISITQAATQCGFNDSNYFTRVFKRITGMTPKKYARHFGPI